MGRAKYNCIPRCYVAVPTIDSASPIPAAGASYTGRQQAGSHLCYAPSLGAPHYPRTAYSVSRIPAYIAEAAVVHAVAWSLQALADGTVVVRPLGAGVSAVYPVGAGFDRAVLAATKHYTGLHVASALPGQADDGALHGLVCTVRGGGTAVSGFSQYNSALSVACDGAEQVAYPTGFTVIAPVGACGSGTTRNALPGIPTTHFPGPVAGGYITLPAGAVDTGTNAALTLARTIPVPLRLRLHEVCFQAATAPTGNTVRLKNETTGLWLTPETALAGSGMQAVVVSAASLTNRTISRGDVLGLYFKAASTQYTSLMAVLTGHTLGHCVDNPALDAYTYTSGLSPYGGGVKLRQTFSGPVVGGFAVLPMGYADVAISQTDQECGRTIAPFKCRPVGVAFQTGTTATTSTSFRFYNETKGEWLNDAVTGGAVSTTNPYSYADIAETTAGKVYYSTRVIDKGDVISMRTTTGGVTAVTRAGGYLVAHVLDFVAASRLLD